jgi:hypothetical protein
LTSHLLLGLFIKSFHPIGQYVIDYPFPEAYNKSEDAEDCL